MREVCIIEIDKTYPPIIEIALIKFMTEVFNLVRESKCIGKGLNITKIEAEEYYDISKFDELKEKLSKILTVIDRLDLKI